MRSSGNCVCDINQHFWSNPNIPHLVIRSTCNSTIGYKAHSHSELSVGIIDSGSTCLIMNEQETQLHKGDLVLIEPRVVHACNPIAGKARSYYMLYINNTWCCDLLSSIYGQTVQEFVCVPNILSDQIENTLLLRLVDELLSSGSSDAILQLNNFLFELLIQYCVPVANARAYNELAYKVKAKLVEDIVLPPSMDDLALEFKRSKESIIRIFKRCFGITPRAFLNNHRIEKAKFLLRQGVDIIDVALDVGYSDQSQMHRAFVKYTAATPRQYQLMMSISDNK